MYSNELKKKMCQEICFNSASTIKTAQKYNVPLKTLENWITAFHKNPNCFDSPDNPDFHFIDSSFDCDYDDLSYEELKHQLMRKDIEIARLKKGYLVKEGGTGEKVFVSFSKKNTK